MVKKTNNKKMNENYLLGWKDSLKEIKKIAKDLSSENGDISYIDLIEKINILLKKDW